MRLAQREQAIGRAEGPTAPRRWLRCPDGLSLSLILYLYLYLTPPPPFSSLPPCSRRGGVPGNEQRHPCLAAAAKGRRRRLSYWPHGGRCWTTPAVEGEGASRGLSGPAAGPGQGEVAHSNGGASSRRALQDPRAPRAAFTIADFRRYSGGTKVRRSVRRGSHPPSGQSNGWLTWGRGLLGCWTRPRRSLAGNIDSESGVRAGCRRGLAAGAPAAAGRNLGAHQSGRGRPENPSQTRRAQ